jgi:hypothetical protein
LPSRHLGYLDSRLASLPRSRRHQPRPALHRSWYRHIRNLFRRCRLAQLWCWCAVQLPIVTGLWVVVQAIWKCRNVRRAETRRVKHFLEFHCRGARSRAEHLNRQVGALRGNLKPEASRNCYVRCLPPPPFSALGGNRSHLSVSGNGIERHLDPAESLHISLIPQISTTEVRLPRLYCICPTKRTMCFRHLLILPSG